MIATYAFEYSWINLVSNIKYFMFQLTNLFDEYEKKNVKKMWHGEDLAILRVNEWIQFLAFFSVDILNPLVTYICALFKCHMIWPNAMQLTCLKKIFAAEIAGSNNY